MAYPEDFDEDYCICPRCDGHGDVDCHCGGDLCGCENEGRAICPLCLDEGEVPKDEADLYLTKRAENHASMMEAWKKTAPI